jgi:hypothetical protein
VPVVVERLWVCDGQFAIIEHFHRNGLLMVGIVVPGVVREGHEFFRELSIVAF